MLLKDMQVVGGATLVSGLDNPVWLTPQIGEEDRIDDKTAFVIKRS